MACVIVLCGCATSTATYSPPAAPNVVNTKLINKPFDVVWEKMVKELSGDFFVINNIDKNSRLINLSFSSQKPSEFVDCGSSTRTLKSSRGDKIYTYKTADSTEFVTTNDQGALFQVRRISRLEGRTNIYVAPEGAGTNVTVNSKYVVSIAVNVEGGRAASTENFVADPSTKTPFNNGTVTCYATGKIEELVLRAAQ